MSEAQRHLASATVIVDALKGSHRMCDTQQSMPGCRKEPRHESRELGAE
jgi:hypothetical protein